MARVYTTNFLSLDPEVAGDFAWAVPDGFTAVIRNMTFTYRGVSGSFFLPWFQVTVGITASNVIWQISGRNITARTFQWEGREVLTPLIDQLFTVHLPVPQCSFRANGYLLSD